MRTMKELVWLGEWQSTPQLVAAIDVWVEDYNEGYLHSTLPYKTPGTFERDWLTNPAGDTPNLAA